MAPAGSSETSLSLLPGVTASTWLQNFPEIEKEESKEGGRSPQGANGHANAAKGKIRGFLKQLEISFFIKHILSTTKSQGLEAEKSPNPRDWCFTLPNPNSYETA